MIRGAPAVRIRPKFELLSPDVGLLKFALFTTLKTSQRNWNLCSAGPNVRAQRQIVLELGRPDERIGLERAVGAGDPER